MANISKVYLLNTPLEDDMKNTLYFASASAQQTYFNSVIGKTYTNVSYQSDTITFRCPAQVDTVRQYNYLMYQNTAYSNKWFYCFIKKSTYVSDGYTDVEFEVDPLQTFMFDITVRASFVEREHTNNDTIGANTIPEGLETGEYIVQPPDQPAGSTPAPTTKINYLTGTNYVIVGVADTGLEVAMPTPDYNGVFGGVYYIAFATYADARGYLYFLQKKFTEDPVVTIFMSPAKLIDVHWYNKYYNDDPNQGVQFQYGLIQPSSTPKVLNDVSITKPTTIDGYAPRNQKLLAHPYQFLDISNNAGSSHVYQYELFKGSGDTSSSTCNFSVRGAIGTGCSIQCIPVNYNKTSQASWNFDFLNYEEALDAPKLPTCSWTNDAYLNWLTQNGLNLNMSLLGDMGKVAIGTGILLGVATGGVGAVVGAAALAGGAVGIASTMAEVNQKLKVPDSAKNGANQGDLLYASKRSFSIYKKCIKREYAKILDEYFDLFGYKTCRVKVPLSNHRQNWWYTKTLDVNIVGNVPNDELNKIKQAYNNGLTFWKNPANFLNYSVSNGIV